MTILMEQNVHCAKADFSQMFNFHLMFFVNFILIIVDTRSTRLGIWQTRQNSRDCLL